METTLTQDVGQAHSDNKPAHAQDGIDSTGQDPGQDPGPEVLDTTLTEDVFFERLILFNVLKSFNPYKLSDLQHVLELRTIKGLLTDDDLIESYFKQTWKFKDDDFWLAGWKTMGLKKLVEEIRAAHPNVTGAPMSVGGELFKPHERALLESEVTKAALLRTWGCLRYVPQRVYANALVGLEVIRAVSTKASINKLRRQKQRWVLISTDVHSHVLTLSLSLSLSLSHSRFARSERFARSHQYFEWACSAGLDTKVIRTLVDECRIKTQDVMYAGCVRAAMMGHFDILEFLSTTYKMRVDANLVKHSIWSGNVDAVDRTVEFVSKKTKSNPMKNAEVRTACLCTAAEMDFDAVALHLISRYGANVNGRHAASGNTPLHGAAMKGCMSVIQVLLAAGADLNAKNKRDETPLCLAEGNCTTNADAWTAVIYLRNECGATDGAREWVQRTGGEHVLASRQRGPVARR